MRCTKRSAIFHALPQRCVHVFSHAAHRALGLHPSCDPGEQFLCMENFGWVLAMSWWQQLFSSADLCRHIWADRVHVSACCASDSWS